MGSTCETSAHASNGRGYPASRSAVALTSSSLLLLRYPSEQTLLFRRRPSRGETRKQSIKQATACPVCPPPLPYPISRKSKEAAPPPDALQLIPLITAITARGAPKETELAILFYLLSAGRGVLASKVFTASDRYLRTLNFSGLIPARRHTRQRQCQTGNPPQKGIPRHSKLRAARARQQQARGRLPVATFWLQRGQQRGAAERNVGTVGTVQDVTVRIRCAYKHCELRRSSAVLPARPPFALPTMSSPCQAMSKPSKRQPFCAMSAQFLSAVKATRLTRRPGCPQTDQSGPQLPWCLWG